MPPKKRRSPVKANRRPMARKSKKQTGNSGRDSVDAGVERALDSFLSPEAKAQHKKGEKEFKRTYL